ncbi:MAG: alpha/beta hydrolase [Gemmatimonadaceae bacterium]
MLLLHGFGDTPQTLSYVAASLHAAGFHVRAPLLPGHGRTVDEFDRSTAESWISHARGEYESMVSAYRTVGLAGLSMGGAIAAIIAADDRRLPALVLLAPYVGMPGSVATAALTHRVWGRFAGQFGASSVRSILDPEERAKNLAYGVTTAGSIHQLYRITRMARAALRSIKAPTLIMQSRHDNRVAGKVAEYAYRTIPASDKRLVFVERGGHILTVDHDRELVATSVRDWFTAHMG